MTDFVTDYGSIAGKLVAFNAQLAANAGHLVLYKPDSTSIIIEGGLAPSLSKADYRALLRTPDPWKVCDVTIEGTVEAHDQVTVEKINWAQ